MSAEHARELLRLRARVEKRAKRADHDALAKAFAVAIFEFYQAIAPGSGLNIVEAADAVIANPDHFWHPDKDPW